MKYDAGGRRDFIHVVRHDAYSLRRFPPNYFTHVLDIGANIGAFSILSRCLFPDAKILAVEPAQDTFEMLRDNTELFDITYLRAALGDGESLSFLERTPDMSVRNVFLKRNCAGYSSPSFKLSQLCEHLEIPSNAVSYLKIDCEGGERSLVDYNEASTLRAMACFAIELHYQGSHWDEWRDEMRGFLLSFEHYKKFLSNALEKTHVAVLPLVKNPQGVSEHMFVHKKHINAFADYGKTASGGLSVYQGVRRALSRLVR